MIVCGIMFNIDLSKVTESMLFVDYFIGESPIRCRAQALN